MEEMHCRVFIFRSPDLLARFALRGLGALWHNILFTVCLLNLYVSFDYTVIGWGIWWRSVCFGIGVLKTELFFSSSSS